MIHGRREVNQPVAGITQAAADLRYAPIAGPFPVPPLPARTVPALLNGWVNADPPFQAPSYWMDQCGVVHIDGECESGVNFSAFFVLPVGYRPSRQLYFVSITGANGLARVDILPTGDVKHGFGTVGANGIFLDGITFRPD